MTQDKKLNTELPYDTALLFLHMLERNENTGHTKTGTAMFKASSFIIAKK